MDGLRIAEAVAKGLRTLQKTEEKINGGTIMCESFIETQKNVSWSKSVHHPSSMKKTGLTDLFKLEQLVRVLCDLRNQEKKSSLFLPGAIGTGRKVLGLQTRPTEASAQAGLCFCPGQGALISLYQRLLMNITRYPLRY